MPQAREIERAGHAGHFIRPRSPDSRSECREFHPEMVESVCSRTGLRNRRRQTASSTDSSRSSLSSSWMATSASRVTWNGWDSTISSPGNRRLEIGRDHLLDPDEFEWRPRVCIRRLSRRASSREPPEPSPAAAAPRALSGARKCSCRPVRVASRSTIARFRLRFEICGKGRPGSNASGVSTGKMVSRVIAVDGRRVRGRRARRSRRSRCRCSRQTRQQLVLEAIVNLLHQLLDARRAPPPVAR